MLLILWLVLVLPITAQDDTRPAYCTDTFRSRPILSGEPTTRADDEFVVHYTLTGDDATTDAYIDVLMATLRYAYDIQPAYFDLLPPLRDCGEGGDTRFDIYVINLENPVALGWTRLDRIIGDNPHTAHIERGAAVAYLELDNNMNPYAPPTATNLLSVGVFHEFHHAMQFNYHALDTNHSFYEWGAVLAERLFLPDKTRTYTNIRWALQHTHRCFEQRRQGLWRRPYVSWLLLDSIMRDTDRSIYPTFVRELGQQSVNETLYRVLAEYDTTPQLVMENAAIRYLLRDYTDANQFGDTTISLDSIIETNGVYTAQKPVESLGWITIQLNVHDTLSLRVVEPNITLIYVGIRDDEAVSASLGQGGSIDTQGDDASYVIALNTHAHSSLDECQLSPVTLTIDTVQITPLPTSDLRLWGATQFLPPPPP